MNILLANMPIRFNTSENLEPPLGISYIAAVLEQAKERVYLKDFEVEDFSLEVLEDFIQRHQIDVVGVSFRSASYASAKTFIRGLKAINPDLIIVIGGHHTTAFPQETLKDLDCDIAVRGEGEFTFLDIVKSLRGKLPLSEIKGISYRDNHSIHHNSPREQFDDLDSLPFPARHLLPSDKYTVATMITSRGCPFDCIYCDKGVSTRKVKFRSLENIFQEILSLQKDFAGKLLYIVDDFLFFKKERAMDLLDAIIRDKSLHLRWLCQARVDGVSEDLLVKAKESGCFLVMYGIETGDPDELKYIRKQTTLEQARLAVEWTKKADIEVRANFMLGFPISTKSSVINSIKFAKSLSLDVVRFFAATPLPNTELWNYVFGPDKDISEIDWQSFDFYNPVIKTKELSKEEVSFYIGAAYLYALKKKAILSVTVYLIPNLIRLFKAVSKTKRIRGNLSTSFTPLVNLVLDLGRVIKNKTFKEKIKYLIKINRVAASIK